MSTTWHFTYLQRQLRAWFARLYYDGTDWISTLRALAQHRGLDFNAEFDLKQWQFITPYRLRTLIAAAQEFDFPHDSKYRKDYIGPLIMLDRKEVVDEPDYQQALQSIAAKKRSDVQRSLIFCSMGTMDSSYDYFRRVIDAVADQPNWDLILAVGNKLPLDRFDPLPDNAYLFQKVPQLDALKQADLCLNHGGISTINECILLGVPMLVYSDGFFDRNGNAARVAYHDLGLRGDFYKDTADQIARNIEQLLTDHQYKANVKQMQQIYLSYHNSDTVAQLVHEMLNNNEKEPL
ncbi:MAG: nucleotide disphospho-sugar-binding domain-containing protein [Chloroflexota bacterium]